MVMIDDATSEVFACFSEEEATFAALEAFRGYVGRYGLPRALHVDRASIYRCDREARIAENLSGKEPTTQFGRAMEERDVRIIMAHSPQAKGRVERVHGTPEVLFAEPSQAADAERNLERGLAILSCQQPPQSDFHLGLVARQASSASQQFTQLLVGIWWNVGQWNLVDPQRFASG